MTYLKELTDLYSTLSFDEVEAAYQFARRNLTDMKDAYRAGGVPKGAVNDALADFRAIRGVHYTMTQKGAL